MQTFETKSAVLHYATHDHFIPFHFVSSFRVYNNCLATFSVLFLGFDFTHIHKKQ